jgi:hypothetical protein
MGSIAAVPLQCCATLAGSFAATCCFKAMGLGSTENRSLAKLLYFALQLWLVAVMLLLRDVAEPSWLSWVPNLNACQQAGDPASCYGEQLAYRANFSAALLYLVLFTVSWFSTSVTSQYFVAKFTLVAVLPLALAFCPNDFFEAYSGFCSYAAFPFLLAQIVILIDFGYTWNETWAANGYTERNANILDESLGRRWFIGIVFASVCLFLFAVVGDISLFVSFREANVRWLVSGVLLGVVVCTAVSISEWAEHGAVLPSAVVAAYSYFLTYCAVGSTGIAWPVAVACFTIFVQAWDPKESPDLFHKSPPEPSSQLTTGDGAREVGPPLSPYIFCSHLFAVFYLCCCVTDWGATAGSKYDQHTAGVACLLVIYLWTLCAPQLLPNREF